MHRILINRKEFLFLILTIILLTFTSSSASILPSDFSSEGSLIFGPYTFVREEGVPKTERISFTLEEMNCLFYLRLTNGTAEGGKRVSSARVRLNGKEIFRPSQFNQQIATLDRQISLEKGENLLEVELRSAPGSFITIEIFCLPPKVCSIFGPHQFIRAKGKPIEETIEFDLSSQFISPFSLNLINGNPDGSNRVDSAIVRLNETVLFDQNDFNEQIGFLSKEISLLSVNTLEVKLMGAPGDHLTIDILGYDNIPPIVTITHPVNGETFTENLTIINGRVDDPLASVTVNGREVSLTPEGMFTLDEFILSEGENIIQVVARDSCGNQGEDQIKVYLSRGDGGPRLVFCAFAMGPRIAFVGDGECREQVFARDVGSIYGETDESASSVFVNDILLPDGELVSEEGDIIWGYREGIYFYAEIRLPALDGIYFITAKAIDGDGDETKATISFIRDTVSPHLTILSPDNGWITNNSIIQVTGRVDDPEAIVRISGSDPLSITDGYFTGIYTLHWEGENLFYVTASDLAGNTHHVIRRVILDTQAPELNIISPEEGQILNTPLLTIKGTMIDENGDKITVEVNHGAPQPLTLIDSNFTGSVSLNSGENLLILKAVDKASNATTVERSVLVDLEPPNLDITSPKDGEIVSGMVKVVIEASDSISGIFEVSLFIDNQLYAILNRVPYTFSLDTSTLTPGSHILKAQAMDRAGNQTEQSILISIIAPLAIEITSPINGSTINKAKTIIQGRIYSQTGETGVVVNGVLAEVQGDYFAVQIPLQIGENIITATAKRSDGLQGQTSIVIHSETQEETIRLTPHPESGALDRLGGLNVTLEVDVFIQNPVVNISWDLDGDGIFESTGNETSYNVRYQSPGIYLPKVRISDDQGNVYEEATIINVLSREEMDALLKSKWEGMKTKLIDKDLTSAMEFFIEPSREIYQRAFEVIRDELPQIVLEMKDIEPIFIRNNVAEYRIERLHRFDDGTEQMITYYIYFVKDRDGLWRIDRF